ncbi:MAG: GYF domain-containing protein [Kofleriaceae bacterium]
MKIVCDACSAKYSISDDKIQGKVYKIHCKKCSNIIVVRGNASAAAAPEPSHSEKDTRVFDYGYDDSAGNDSVWHVVVDQDQVGPMTVAEVGQRFAAGEIDAETYVWREGFSDWKPLSQVDTFASLLADPVGVSSAPSSDVASSLFGNAPAESRGGGAFAVSDLFGGDADAPAEDDGVFAARRAEPQDAAAQAKLRGERSENSVLFSLSNLAQLASDAPRPKAAASSSTSSFSGAAQHGGGEGSGLIDIRSMASAYLAPDKGGVKAAGAMSSAADLPVFTSSSFGEAAVMVPIVRGGGGNNNKLIYGLVALVSVLAIIAVVMVVVLLRGGDKAAARSEQLASADTGSGSAGGVEAGSAAGAAPGSAAAPVTEPPPPETPTTPTAAAPTEEPPTTPEPAKTRDPKRTDSAKKPRTATTSSSAKPSSDKPSNDKPTKAASSDCDAVACLVDPSQACCAKRGGGTKPSSGGSASKSNSNLPEQLDSSMIKAGIAKVKGKAQACGSKSSATGAVKVRIKATPEGKVGSVDVLSSPDSALGNCVASALRGATFAKTQRGMGFAYTLSF